MNIRLASDPTGEVAKKYGVLYEDCTQALFIIDPEGKIHHDQPDLCAKLAVAELRQLAWTEYELIDFSIFH